MHDYTQHAIALATLLLEDVVASEDRLDLLDTQSSRRDVVRTTFAAIEGMTWLARDHVRNSLEELGELEPIAKLAFLEQTYSISDSGGLVIQARSAPLAATFRFIVAQAMIISPEISIDFGHQGWSSFRKATIVRNRITHPKPGLEPGLDISDDDLTEVRSGSSWFFATLDYVMASTNLALVNHTKKAREIIERLKSGDPEALALYQRALDETLGKGG